MQFYVLRKEIGCETETEYERVEPVVRGDPLRCPECDGSYGMKRWLPPYRVRLQRHGSILGDMIFDVGNDILVSQSFITAWTERGLKGLEPLYPVEVVSVRPKSLQKKLQPYLRLDIQPTSPRVDRERSVFVGANPECLFCGRPRMYDAILHLAIDKTTWSGEDIFAPWGVSRVIVSQNVVDLAEDHGLTNVTTLPIEKFHWDPLRRFGTSPQDPPN